MSAPINPNRSNDTNPHPAHLPEDSHVQEVAKNILGQAHHEHQGTRQLPVKDQTGNNLGIEVLTSYYDAHPLAGRKIRKED
jgi:hypothetical protein